MNLIPHAVVPCAWHAYDASFGDGKTWHTDGTTVTGAIVNSSLYGDGPGGKSDYMVDQMERYRLTHCSATVELVSTAFTNQGRALGVQLTSKFAEFNPASYVPAQGIVKAWRHIVAAQSEDDPAYEQASQLATAYKGAAKDGLYMPLKLSDNRWYSSADCKFFSQLDTDDGGDRDTDRLAILAAPPTNDALYKTFPWYSEEAYDGQPWFVIESAKAPEQRKASAAVAAAAAPPKVGAPGDEDWGGYSFTPLLSDFIGKIFLYDLDPKASVRVTVRWGIELQVNPASNYKSALRPTPDLDHAALDMYRRITQRLPDGFPAAYNTGEKIWGTISTIVKTIAPFFSLIPDIGPAMTGISEIAVGVGDEIQRRLASDRRVADVESAARQQPTQRPSGRAPRTAAQVAQRARLERIRRIGVPAGPQTPVGRATRQRRFVRK